MKQIPRLLAVAVAALARCLQSRPFTPNIDSVAATITCSRSRTTDLGGPRDWVAMGATLRISLAPNGTTSGRLFMPGAGLGGSDVDVNMTGTWTLAVATVEFHPSYDTLLRDVTFIAYENRLIGDHAYGSSGVSVRIILTK